VDNAFNVITDDPGAAARENNDEVWVILSVCFLYCFQEFSLATINDVTLIKSGAGCRF